MGARIGVHRKGFGFNDAVDKLMNDCIDIIKRHGATVVDPADIPTAGKFDDSELEVLLYEFKADLNSYLASLGPRAPVKSLKEIIDSFVGAFYTPEAAASIARPVLVKIGPLMRIRSARSIPCFRGMLPTQMT